MRRSSVTFGLAAVLYAALTAALTWPLPISAGSKVPNDLGDPLFNTYLIAWNARTTPLTERWWNLPQFHPASGVTAFSEHLLGLSVITTPIVTLTGNPLLAYNVAFFLSFVLCALAAHVLCYVLTRRHDVSVIGALAFAFAPYRMEQFAHIQVLSAYWMPLSLTGLHLYFADRRLRWLALFATAWVMQALACGYFLFYLSVLVGLWLVWFAVGRERWTEIGKVLAAWAVAAAAIAPIAYGYLKYQRAYGLQRGIEEIEAFSADVASLLKASRSLWVWGWLDVVDRPESALFPGLTVVVVLAAGLVIAWVSAARTGAGRLAFARWLLAGAVFFGAVAATPAMFGPWKLEIAGSRLLSVTTARKPASVAVLLTVVALVLHPSVRVAWRQRSPLVFYALATVVMWVLSLGPSPTLMNREVIYKAPYAWLMLLPGLDGVRVPARFWGLATLCLAVGAALAVSSITARWSPLRRWLPALVCSLVVVEGWPRPLSFHDPPMPRPAHVRAAARLELPTDESHDVVALYRSIEHRRPTINGYSGYFAPHYWALQALVWSRSDGLLQRLAELGPLEIVVDDESDRDGTWRRFVTSYPDAELVHAGDGYTAFRVPLRQSVSRQAPTVPAPLPIAHVRGSPFQDLAGHMTDGERVTRWHTGPQRPGSEVLIDLGVARDVSGLVMALAGYVGDFPRELTIEASSDGSSWTQVWSGPTGLQALNAALADPLNVPLTLTFDARASRYLRMRQHGRDDTYYWSISELTVLGK